MSKRSFLFLMALYLCAFVSTAYAEALKISDYVFTWYAAGVEDVKMDIEKKPAGVSVVLRSPGGPIARVSTTPEQAIEIAKVLKTTDTYYDKQMKAMDLNAEDMVPVGDFKVYFTSKRGRNFQVSVRGAGALSAAVLMTRNQALKIADHLLKAKKMAALVNQRIKP